MTEPRKPSGRIGVPLNIRLRPDLDEALRLLVDKARPRTTITAVVEEALERLLTEKGFWEAPGEDE